MHLDLESRSWRPVSQDKCRELGIFPNSLMHNAATNEAALVVLKSARFDEYAMSQAALEYLLAAVETNRLTAGYVVLATRHMGKLSYVYKDVVDVATIVDPWAPREGPWAEARNQLHAIGHGAGPFAFEREQGARVPDA